MKTASPAIATILTNTLAGLMFVAVAGYGLWSGIDMAIVGGFGVTAGTFLGIAVNAFVQMEPPEPEWD